MRCVVHSIGLLAAAVLGVAPAAAQEAREVGTAAMVARLEAITEEEGRTNPYAGSVRAQALAAVTPPAALADRLRYRSEIARYLLYAGQSEEAASALEDILREAGDPSVSPAFVSAVRQLLALSYLRVAMQRNCVSGPAAARCSVPVRQDAVHPADGAARRAIDEYARILGDPPDESTALAAQWLLNLAYMTVGEYPFHVPERWLVPPEAFRPEYDVGRFADVAGRLGIDDAGRKGGSVMDDFDGDGRLDIMASSAGLFPVAAGENPNQLRYFRNEGDGAFSDRTVEAGLDGLVSGLHVVQADYDNDGFLDLLVLRGAWLDAPHPNSLLRNNGDGTFSDVTEAAGLLMPAPTQAAAWGDYDNDGWVDLFIGNETRRGVADAADGAAVYPSRLFRNDGDGTFTDVAAEAGVAVVGFIKGAAWGDYDNDGRLDLYVTQIRPDQPNRLFRNEGPGPGGAWSFRDAAAEAGVEGPPVSFPTWFFDYDNDGWEDLFVSGFSGGLADIVLEILGQPHRGQLPRLYRNDRDGTFTDVTRAVGLDRIMVSMGSNFGDFDNDGFLDLYLGTGDPDYRMLIPNLAFRNAAGRRFLDVTASGGFGHLQKGHGVSFGDVDADGDQDMYHVSGGAYEGDTFPNALYLNPGHGNRWLTLRLEGAASNRAAIGARIRVVAATPDGDREVHVTVGSGGSFGGSSLQQEIGLGAASGIRTVAITWPVTGETDVYTGVGLDRAYRVREGDPALTPVVLAPLDLRPPAGDPVGPTDGPDHRARGLDAAAVGDWPEALGRFRQALALAPDDPMLNWYLGMALRLSGDDAEGAAAYLAEAARLDPALTARAHLTIGTVREEGGRVEEAIGHFTLAASEASEGGEAHFRLAEALRRSGRAAAALGYYEQVPDRRGARFGEAMALVALGRYREAHDRLAAGVERHPWEPAFPLALARLLAAAPDDALRDGERALALAQALAEEVRTTAVAETVAMAHAELGRFSAAVEWQRLAMSVAAEAGQPEAVRRMSANLAAYLRGEPSRTPWQDDELEQASAR